MTSTWASSGLERASGPRLSDKDLTAPLLSDAETFDLG